MLKENVNLENKCGSCKYFQQIGGTAQGECLKKPYHKEVVHDPAHPHICVARTRRKCPMYTPQTNADRIRAMSDEELSMFLAEVENRRSVSGGGAVWKGITNTFLWLIQPAEVGEE